MLKLIIVLSLYLVPLVTFASFKDAPNLEPFMLTPEVAAELIDDATPQSKGADFHLKGMTIQAEDPTEYGVVLSILADRRLNLWRGRPNDFASSHLGQMEIIVDSAKDENGDNIYDASREMPWHSKVTIYHRGDEVFAGTRSISFEKKPTGNHIRQISGTVKLSVPVNLEKYVIQTDDPDSMADLLKRKSIKAVEIKNGIHVKHTKSTPNFKATIMVFNHKEERISVTSSGSSGSNYDNHWFYIDGNAKLQEMRVFIPEKFITFSIPFSINMRGKQNH